MSETVVMRKGRILSNYMYYCTLYVHTTNGPYEFFACHRGKTNVKFTLLYRNTRPTIRCNCTAYSVLFHIYFRNPFTKNYKIYGYTVGNLASKVRVHRPVLVQDMRTVVHV